MRLVFTSVAAVFMGGKSYFLRNTGHLIYVLIMMLGSLNSASAEQRGYSIAPIPSWVEPVPAFSQSVADAKGAEHGYHDLLSDLQINGVERGNTRVFNAVEYLLTNSFGVENFSDIDISFNTSFQSLILHELTIERDDVRINRIDTAQFDVIQPQIDSPTFAFEATTTVSIVLDDVQAGDTIRYSYTLAGANPVFAGHREFHVNTELWTQLDRQHVRVLTASNDPLSRRIRGANISLAVKDMHGVQEITFDQRDVNEISTENGVPSWREAPGVVVFSDMDSWQDVVEWARPLYQLPELSHASVVQIASSIKRSNTSRDSQIGAALRWVQEEITSSELEFGINLRLPSKPETTISRGIGNAQDKAILVMAILRELNIESSAALVNSQRGLEASDYPFRLLAFNHVVVHVERNGDSHFIDPTRRGQSGALGELSEPNYGRALVLAPGAVDLVAIDESRSIVQQAVHKELTLPAEWSEIIRTSMDSSLANTGGAAGLKVTSQKQGLLAEQIRQSVANGGTGALNKTYLDYYQVLFPSISAFETIELKDSADNNSTFVENYSIDNFWEFNEKVGEHRWLYADEIIGYLDLPAKTENRKRPYELRHPVSITETWVVPVSDNLRMHLEEASVDNEWISFSKTVVVDEVARQATIRFAYATLANEVGARDLDAYVTSVERVNDHASFYLQKSSPALAAAAPVQLPWNTAKVKFWVIFLAMIYFTGWWLHFMKKYRKTVDYYSDEYTGH